MNLQQNSIPLKRPIPKGTKITQTQVDPHHFLDISLQPFCILLKYNRHFLSISTLLTFCC